MAAYEVAKEQQYLDETLQKAWQYLSHIAYQTNGINGEIIIEIIFNMIFPTKHSYTLKYVNILTIQGHSKFAKEKLTNVYWRYQM